MAFSMLISVVIFIIPRAPINNTHNEFEMSEEEITKFMLILQLFNIALDETF